MYSPVYTKILLGTIEEGERKETSEEPEQQALALEKDKNVKSARELRPSAYKAV